jgi:hypothetical protein
MSTQNNNGARPKWSLGAGAWFATALLLLSLSSGGVVFSGGAAFAASSALAASSTSQNCHAVLWLLHEMQTAAPHAAQPIASRAISQAEISSLLSQLKEEPVATTNSIAINGRAVHVERREADPAQNLDSQQATSSLVAILSAAQTLRAKPLPSSASTRWKRTKPPSVGNTHQLLFRIDRKQG